MLYFNAWAFRYRSPLIDAVVRQNWRDGWQSAYRYYYVEDADDDDEPAEWDQRKITYEKPCSRKESWRENGTT